MYKADHAHCRIVWQRSLHIHSTLESVTTIMTLPTHCLIQTVCGLCVHCTLRPIGAVTGRFNRLDEDIPLDLIFFSPFGELRSKAAGLMESKGIHRVYEPSPVPTLYVLSDNKSCLLSAIQLLS